MRIVAMMLAVMLYVSVNIESPEESKSQTTSFFSTTASTESVTLTDIPVAVYYDEQEYVVTGIPQTVTVSLEGPTSALTAAKQVRDFEIYADLRELPVGTHRVQLQYKNVSEKLAININPSVITVNVHEKVTESFSVEVDFINKEKMKEGYTPEEAIVQPNTVQITGAKEVLDRIALVKARVNLEGVDKTLEMESIVTVYDQNGTVLPVEVDPSVVLVTVPVKSPSKLVPINVKQKGELPDGLSIKRLTVEPKEATIYGEQSVLDKIEFIDGIEIDLSKISKDTTLEIEIPKPNGVTKIIPEKAEVTIELDKEQSISFEGVQVNPIGLNDRETINFLDPENAKVDILLKGSGEILKNINESDIKLYVNVADVGEGEHQLDIEVNGPQNISWSLSKKKIKLKILNRDVAEDESGNRTSQTTQS